MATEKLLAHRSGQTERQATQGNVRYQVKNEGNIEGKRKIFGAP